MADKGLVLDLPDPNGDDTLYMLAPPVVGFFEFSMMRLSDGLPKARLAQAYQAYTLGDPAFLDEISNADTLVGRTLVHESVLTDVLLPQVLDWERATACVEEATRLSVAVCYCRHKAQHLGTACEYPLETCMSLGGGADWVIRHGFGRQIERTEGLELLSAPREAGLVHIADNVREEITYLCSCCACCCGELHSAQKDRSIVAPSGFQPATSAAACTGCGRCVRACPVQAISLVARDPHVPAGEERSKRLRSRVDYDRCLGCGVCVGTCRHDALEMERRQRSPSVPKNTIEFVTRRMLEKGRLADLLVDGTAGRGPAFAHAVLNVITSLPPAEKLLARDQVRSRFVRFALARSDRRA